MEPDTDQVWVTPKSRELFRFAPDEEIYYENFLKVIQPEDREQVDQAVQQALQSRESLIFDYRIILPDGAIRWITARGERFPRTNGDPERMMGLNGKNPGKMIGLPSSPIKNPVHLETEGSWDGIKEVNSSSSRDTENQTKRRQCEHKNR
jgi:PAS domain-containing protein